MNMLSIFRRRAIYKAMSRKRLPYVIRTVLYVCKGNVCRSPIAEFISKKIANTHGLLDIQFYSRGLEVTKKNPPSKGAVAVCTSNSIDISSHESTAVNDDIVNDSDIILVMEYDQMVNMIQRYPSIEKKVFLLPVFFGKKYKGSSSWIISDPYGRSLNTYVTCYLQIQQCIEGFFHKLMESQKIAR